MLIDSHCHLDFAELYNDLDNVIKRMQDASVAACLTISTRIKQFDKIKSIAEHYDNVWCSVGTHPHNAAEELIFDVEHIVKLTKHPKVVAIGEVGLDYHYQNSPKKAQIEGFLRHIEAARITKLPLIIHARSADDDMCEILAKEIKRGEFSFILHCFSSGEKLAKLGLDLGGYISFSGIITFKNAQNIRDIAALVPNEKLLVETDAPFLAPTPFRGKVNEPAFVKYCAFTLAKIKNIAPEEIAAITSKNFRNLFAKVKL